MPIYEFRCSDCGSSQETLVSSSGDSPVCESCGGDALKRKLSVFAVSSASPEPACACAGEAGGAENMGSCGCGCR